MTFNTLLVLTTISSVSAFSSPNAQAAIPVSPTLIGNEEAQKSIYDPMGLYSEDSKERRLGLIQSLESSETSFEKDQTVIDPLSLYKDASELTENVEMSASLPFLKRPALLNGSLPGDRGFDPFNFASDTDSLNWYRDAEIKHARLAMLATVGWPIAELTHKAFASQLDLESALASQDKAPSVLNGGLSLTNPLFWVGAISAAAALEFIATKNEDTREPGDYGFDPLSLAGNNANEKFYMQEAEIFNGRLAMLAITGFVTQEFYTNMSVINETPIFFKPFGDVVAQLMESGAANSM
jgi:hypothetical protein